MSRVGLLRTLAPLAAFAVCGTVGFAQTNRLDSLFAAGWTALEAARYGEAADMFGALIAESPDFLDRNRGSVAYWLGAALRRNGRDSDAHEVWRNGMTRLVRQGIVDARLADAFVRSTFEGDYSGDRAAAADAYLRLLLFLDGPIQPELRPMLQDHVRELIPILPPRLAASHRLEPFVSAASDSTDPVVGTGTRLAAWWRANDVAPGTRKNERLEEHLQRVAHARTHFRPRGSFDARGLLYIRFGPPARQVSIDFYADTRFRHDVIFRGITLQQSDFPDNEIWIYNHIIKDAVFILYKQGGAFELGEVTDLIPAGLEGGIGPTTRGLTKSKALIRTLELIYEVLSMHHVGFASRYSDVLAASDLIDRQEMFPDRLTDGHRSDLAAGRALRDAQVEDEWFSVRRNELLPQDYTNVFDEVEQSTMPARLARFLDPDGTTRTELYWGVPPGGLAPSRRVLRNLEKEGVGWDDAVMLQSIAHRDAAQWTRRLDHVRLILPDIGKDRTASLAPRTYVARGDTARFSLAAQWNLHPAWKIENGRLAFGDDPIRTFLARFDSIDVLSPVPAELEMSDLKPIVLSENPTLTSVSAEVAADLPGHPVPIAGEGRTLVLYFEVYHLQPDATGEAHFEVAYEVSRPGRPETATRSSSRYRTSHSTAKEAVTIDLARWRGEGEVEISLSVTEASTGRSRSRSVRVTVEQ